MPVTGVTPGLIGNLQRNMFDGGSGPAPVNTWNPADKAASITLSGGDLIATATSTTAAIARAINNASTGKKYWEVTIDVIAGTNVAPGVANAGESLSTYLGATNDSIGYYKGGAVYLNNVNVGPIATYLPTDLIGIALDLDNSKIWFRNGAGDWNNDVIGNQNPATNTGGIDISAITGAKYAAIYEETNVDQLTGNFGATAYGQSAPSGFSNW